MHCLGFCQCSVVLCFVILDIFMHCEIVVLCLCPVLSGQRCRSMAVSDTARRDVETTAINWLVLCYCAGVSLMYIYIYMTLRITQLMIYEIQRIGL